MCIYKERVILQERIKLATGGNADKPSVIEVIDEACDECPIGGIFVTPACRGCISHACKNHCPKNAIKIIDHKATVDQSLCVECEQCVKACPYGAIIHQHRPCVSGCKVKAITVGEDKKATIDYNKCIACGNCVYQCPFGAVSDKSMILQVVDMVRGSDNGRNYNMYAIVAPSLAGQFPKVTMEQIVTAIIGLGFNKVTEVALGADIVLYKEAREFKEKGMLISSCCPSFVSFVEKNFPDLVKYISSTPSPMIETALLIKQKDPTAKVVFIGPCTSKKMEYKLPKCGNAIDGVMSFEELQAYFDALNIDVATCESTTLDDASFFGRIFARSGGVATGVARVGKDIGVDNIRPIVMSGIEECRLNLLKLRLGQTDGNFFEGMACEGGCINGAVCLHHGIKNIKKVDKYGSAASKKTIDESIAPYIDRLLEGESNE
ncbi:MAG: monomeric [FeFe] hydrogenase [Clostridia bacterium]